MGVYIKGMTIEQLRRMGVAGIILSEERLVEVAEPQNEMPCYGCEFSKIYYMEYECLRDSCRYDDEPQTERSE